MKIDSIFKRNIYRSISPVVISDDLQNDVVFDEIDETILSPELVERIQRVISFTVSNDSPEFRKNVLIESYHGSGKSHFLKFIYCLLNVFFRERALAVLKREMSEQKFQLLISTFSKISFDTLICRVHDLESVLRKIKVHLGHSEISSVAYLEYRMKKDGKFSEFVKIVNDKYGFDWDDIKVTDSLKAAFIIDKLAAEFYPQISENSNSFKEEEQSDLEITLELLVDYIKTKDDNFRFVLFLDDCFLQTNVFNLHHFIAQFANIEKTVIICTSTPSNLAGNFSEKGIQKVKDYFFDWKEYIGFDHFCLKRMLDKTKNGFSWLEIFYLKNKGDFESIELNSGSESYPTIWKSKKDDFLISYPFFSYQIFLFFEIINDLLNNQLMDNSHVFARNGLRSARTRIRIVKDSLVRAGSHELGYFISFDLFFDEIEGHLSAKGRDFYQRASHVEFEGENEFLVRVVKILIMINYCSSIGSVTSTKVSTLLLNNLRTPLLEIKAKVEKVINILIERNIVKVHHENILLKIK